SIWTFRPEANARRMQHSAVRLALPELPTDYFIESLKQLIAVDGDWVPSAPETSLYLRPYMYAKEAFLGVRPAHKVAYYVIASPAGAYFTGGVAPVSIWLSTEYARAGRGRSEEHTSELQSRENLVCRLLLEKKKHETMSIT